MSPSGYQETISNEAPSCLRGRHHHHYYRLNRLTLQQLLERRTNSRVGGAAAGVAARHHHRRQQNEEAGDGGLPPPPAALFLDHEDTTRHRVPRLTNNDILAPGLSRQQLVEIIESALDLIGDDEDEFL